MRVRLTAGSSPGHLANGHSHFEAAARVKGSTASTRKKDFILRVERKNAKNDTVEEVKEYVLEKIKVLNKGQ